MIYLRVYVTCHAFLGFFFFKQRTAYEMRISDLSSDVCSSDLHAGGKAGHCLIKGNLERKAATAHQEIHEHRYRLSFEINAKKGQSLGSKGGGYAFAEEGSFGWIASNRRALRSLPPALLQREEITAPRGDRKSTRLNSRH